MVREPRIATVRVRHAIELAREAIDRTACIAVYFFVKNASVPLAQEIGMGP